MLIVGEAINTSRKVKGERLIEAAVLQRDSTFIAELAQRQMANGATYIDVNCGTLTSGEAEALAWLTEVVQQAVAAPICFDSPNPDALEAALSVYQVANGRPMINSITAESERYDKILPFVKQYKTQIIALAMDDGGIQPDPEKRLSVARSLIERLEADGVPREDVYVDPLTFPIGTGDDVAITMLDIIEKLMTEYPGVHTIAGLSNISHGMPVRKLLNQSMTMLAISKGMDAGIVDPNDRYLMGLIAATEALLGKDEFCMNYIALSRSGAFEGI